MNQGRSEWHEARLGLITASRFGDVLARPSSKRYRLYMEELAMERTGQSLPEISKPWFSAGKEYEDEARGTYSFLNDVDVVQTGLIVAGNCGCSPDGLVGNDGGIEIKVRTSASSHLETIEKGMPAVYRPQVQGNMYCTGRAWWDFVSYYVNLSTGQRDLRCFRIQRDDKYIAKLAAAINKFEESLCSLSS